MSRTPHPDFWPTVAPYLSNFRRYATNRTVAGYDPDDLMMDTLLHLQKYWQPGGAIYGLYARTLEHRIADFRRLSYVRMRVLEEGFPESSHESEEGILNRLLGEKVWEEFCRRSFRRKGQVDLSLPVALYLAGYSITAGAKRVGCSISAYKARLHDGRRLLARVVRELAATEESPPLAA